VVLLVVVLEQPWTSRTQVSSSPWAAVDSLASSSTTGEQSAVTFPMGHLDDPSNTFWELFVRNEQTSGWSLRTPKGVADNGGLVLAWPSAGPLTIGFLPSANLTFSPVAQSSEAGLHWSRGEAPIGLARVPNSLGASAQGTMLALSSGQPDSVLTSAGGLSSWKPLVTSQDLASSIRGCSTSAVAAVAVTSSGRPLLGLSCSRGSQLGVAVGSSVATSASSWRNAGPRVLERGATSSKILRLEATPSGVTGLAGVLSSGGSIDLNAIWRDDASSTWSQSAPLAVPTGWSVSATSISTEDASSLVTVLLTDGSQRRLLATSSATRSWTALPSPPARTAAVTSLATETVAFAVNGNRLAIWSLASGSSHWSLSSTSTVPIQYGSSS